MHNMTSCPHPTFQPASSLPASYTTETRHTETCTKNPPPKGKYRPLNKSWNPHAVPYRTPILARSQPHFYQRLSTSSHNLGYSPCDCSYSTNCLRLVLRAAIDDSIPWLDQGKYRLSATVFQPPTRQIPHVLYQYSSLQNHLFSTRFPTTSIP
ncbi:hypothetical protein BDZ85DRAFT_24691 [Elsinoe ampelina]|uniref:Uncharacterized protein n=1 Tax=Elsinoe ampelina TaxID=302913 RepID=A0A6A6G621_9PEZI|nr:hypothetical protein BDZ85DRAFT_24691 [Elsinoe ampelina]